MQLLPAYHIPKNDLAEFHALGNAKDEIWLSLWKVQEMRRLMDECGYSQNKACREVGGGESGRVTHMRLLEWFRGEGWRGLIPVQKLKRHQRPEVAQRPSEFDSYWLSLACQNERSGKAAYEKFARDWRAGARIPGYGTWREWYNREYPDRPMPMQCPGQPDGTSYASCAEMLRKEKTVLAAARKGVAAARSTIQGARRDWSALRPLEEIMVDDVRLDFLVNVWLPGHGWVAAELWLLVAMDVATRRILHWVTCPRYRIKGDDTKHSFTKADMERLMGGNFDKWGLPEGYNITLRCERGTASFDEKQCAALERLTAGRMHVCRTSMIGGRGAGEWADKNIGNSKGKAPLESFFNLMHGIFADTLLLPGQISRRYDESPASTATARLESTKLPYHPDAHTPFATLEDACEFVRAGFAAAEERHDHACIGFGLVRQWRTDPQSAWRPEAELGVLPAPMRGLVEWDSRPETPRERWARLVIAHPLERGAQAGLWQHAFAPDIIEVTWSKHAACKQIGKREFRWWDPTQKIDLPDGQRFMARCDLQALTACGPERAPLQHAPTRLTLLHSNGQALVTLNLHTANTPAAEQIEGAKRILNRETRRAQEHTSERKTRPAKRKAHNEALPDWQAAQAMTVTVEPWDDDAPAQPARPALNIWGMVAANALPGAVAGDDDDF